MSETSAPAAGIRIEILPIIDAQQLRKDVAFSNNDLSSAMMQQASLFVHYGVLFAQASRQVDRLKTRLEIAESFVYRALRDEAVKSGEKFSEPMLAAAVAKHPDVRRLKIAVNEAKQIEAVCKTAVEAFRHRRDMLVQMGLLSREEMKGELTIARKNAVQEAQGVEKEALLGRLREIDHGKGA